MKEIFVEAKSLPEAYHDAIIGLYNYGEIISCNDWNQQQKEVSMTMVVKEPFHEPMISKLYIGGFYELQQYAMEVLDGILDFKIDKSGESTYWPYTYHDRMVRFPVYKDGFEYFNQVDFVVDELKRNSNSRRAVINIRDNEIDPFVDDPACFCKGTKIMTDNGYKNIEDIGGNDIIISTNIEDGSIIPTKIKNYFSKYDNCYNIKTLSKSIEVSHNQKILTKNGWKQTCDLSCDDYIACSYMENINIADNSLWHLIGILHGDGWLSTPSECKRGMTRRDIGISVHYTADDYLIRNLLKNFSTNKIQDVCKYVKSTTLNSCEGISKKLNISDKILHENLMKYIPCGKKVTGIKTLLNVKNMSKEQIIDFLTGLYSSEGCVYFPKSAHPSIQIGMNWKEIIEVVMEMLDILGIEYKYFENGSTCKIYVKKYTAIVDFIKSGIDFRFDSRKQVKFLNIKHQLEHIENLSYLNNKNKLWHYFVFDNILDNNYYFEKINSIDDIGIKEVYDFETVENTHNLIANDIISHNCLQSLQYLIRDGKLHCKVLMRSNDATEATFMNAFAFIMLQKKIADKLGVEVGSYTHRANSFHCYEKDFRLLYQYVSAIRDKSIQEITISYEDCYKELMDESIPVIEKAISKIKAHTVIF